MTFVQGNSPVTVGNSIQQQQVQGPDSEIQQHTIQEDPQFKRQNLTLPDLNIHLQRTSLENIVDEMYKLATKINENYQLTDESLETLKNQGFVPFIKSIEVDVKNKPDDYSNYIGPGMLLKDLIEKGKNDYYDHTHQRTGQKIGEETLNNLVFSGMSAILAGPEMLLWGLIPETVSLIKYGISQSSEKEGQDIIDLWYDRAKKNIQSSYHPTSHLTFYLE